MLEKLKEIALSVMDDKSIEINIDSRLIADLKINSYDLIELVCKVEDEFDVEIPDKKLRSLITVNDVITLIQSQK
ncbi:MAG: acyl carrier protein [Clostridia bacterium]|nr:acyl carrier protein [Clostridia bacterium]